MLVVGTPLAGFAAGLGGVGAGAVGADGAAVTGCDANGFTVTYATSGPNVTSATVAGIADPGCEGGRLSVTLADGTAAVGSGGPVTVAVDGGTADNSVVVPLSPNPAAAVVDRVHVAIAGP